MKAAAAAGDLKGVLAYNEAPLVSVDFNHDAHSSTFDATLTKVVGGTLVKVCAWYDNEWGFSNRMLDTTSPGRKPSDENAAHDGPRARRQAGADP